MQHILIVGRVNLGKTAYAIEFFKKHKNGLFFSQNHSKKDLLEMLNENFKDKIFDDCYSLNDICQKIKNLDFDYIVVDYLQLFSSNGAKDLIEYLNKNGKFIVLVSQLLQSADNKTEFDKSDFRESYLLKYFDNIIYLHEEYGVSLIN